MGIILSIADCIFGSCRSRKYVTSETFKRSESKIIQMAENKLHYACRSTDPKNLKPYQGNIDKFQPSTLVYRTYVPDDKVKWSVKWPEYKPVSYTVDKILKDKPIWADSENPLDIKNWNLLDGKLDRRSHLGTYLVNDGYPFNPIGRTGLRERGQLGKWGVNHAADPIVTKWKRDENNKKVYDTVTNKPILQFVSIQRLDTSAWAIPGGMCDPGEKISQTLKREFMEEATDSTGKNLSTKEQIEEHLNELFENGIEIYRGYVDDPRNTDNAWMETIAYNFHDEDNSVFQDFILEAGDDAGSVTWMDISSKLKLYASHKDFIEKVVSLHGAHW